MDGHATAAQRAAAAVIGAMRLLGVSQEQLAQRTNIPQATLSRRLSGRGPGLNVDEIDAIAYALKVPYASLTGGHVERAA